MPLRGRLFIAVPLLVSSISCAFAADFPTAVTPPAIQASSWALMSYTASQVLTVGNEHQQRGPTSLTKLTTSYVIDHTISSHRITFGDIVTVGKDIRTRGDPVFDGSSLVFLKPGDRINARDLSHGLIADLDNDTCVTLADCAVGDQPQFAALMNQYVEKLYLRDTHFETVHDLDAPGQRSSAYDLAVLSWATIHGRSSVYHMYSQESLTWDGTTQQNRNGLLWDRTMNVDDLKTSCVSGAGSNLIALTVDSQRRLTAAMMGTDGPRGREQQVTKLLH